MSHRATYDIHVRRDRQIREDNRENIVTTYTSHKPRTYRVLEEEHVVLAEHCTSNGMSHVKRQKNQTFVISTSEKSTFENIKSRHIKIINV